MPPLTETYTDPTYGYKLCYPAGWHVSQGWQSIIGWQEMLTFTSYPPDATPPPGNPSAPGGSLCAGTLLWGLIPLALVGRLWWRRH